MHKCFTFLAILFLSNPYVFAQPGSPNGGTVQITGNLSHEFSTGTASLEVGDNDPIIDKFDLYRSARAEEHKKGAFFNQLSGNGQSIDNANCNLSIGRKTASDATLGPSAAARAVAHVAREDVTAKAKSFGRLVVQSNAPIKLEVEVGLKLPMTTSSGSAKVVILRGGSKVWWIEVRKKAAKTTEYKINRGPWQDGSPPTQKVTVLNLDKVKLYADAVSSVPEDLGDDLNDMTIAEAEVTIPSDSK